MHKIFESLSELIGHTPLLEVKNLARAHDLKARVLVKLEYYNPAGSVKDRIAKAMIEDAEARGLLKAGVEIIEPTSGNTGIGLAAIAAAKGYKTTFVLPENMSIERRKLLKIYGADIVLTPAANGMPGAIAKADELAAEFAGKAFVPSQFSNPANPQVHEATTGPEIWEDTEGQVDVLVAGIGTGGTITGSGHFLKQKKSSLRVVAVEPAASPVLSGGVKGPHMIQGIGAGFVPVILDTAVYDEIIKVENQDALETTRMLARSEGVLCGISSGAALWAALELAKRDEMEGKTIVVILPDTGERYLSTALFEEL